MAEPILRVRELTKHFAAGGGWLERAAGVVQAVDRVSFAVARGETLGVVGESGCGKTTLSRMILAAIEPTSGAIEHEGRPLAWNDRRALQAYRRQVQVVFQDPFSSLSPRMRVEEIVAEPLIANTTLGGRERRERVGDLLTMVGLDPAVARRFPHEFSGGQRQRIAIARALSTDSRLIVLDEPVSALDASIRAHVINLLRDLQERIGVAYLFIGHDLAVVSNIADRTAVMYLGRLVEIGPSEEVARAPLHPYTKALFAAALPAMPGEGARREAVVGEVPSAPDPPAGCHYHPRCPFAMPVCRQVRPELTDQGGGRGVACHLFGQAA